MIANPETYKLVCRIDLPVSPDYNEELARLLDGHNKAVHQIEEDLAKLGKLAMEQAHCIYSKTGGRSGLFDVMPEDELPKLLKRQSELMELVPALAARAIKSLKGELTQLTHKHQTKYGETVKALEKLGFPKDLAEHRAHEARDVENLATLKSSKDRSVCAISSVADNLRPANLAALRARLAYRP